MNKIKVSVIGTGHLGSIHTRLWKTNNNVELVGIYDIIKEHSERIANELNCKIFASATEAIINSDALTIAVPTTEHYSLARQCIQNSKHCFIEKPITSKYEEAVELISSAKENNVLIQVGHVERFNPALTALKNYNLSPRFIEVHRLSQFKTRATDVSVIHDLMIHDLDIILWLVKSKVKSIDADGVGVLTKNIDIANARIKFENGAVANITASRISASPMRKMRIFQPNAYISIDFANQKVDVFRISNDNEEVNFSGTPATMLGNIEDGEIKRKIYYEKPDVPKLNPIAEEQKSFISAILNNQPIAINAEEAAEALRIADKIATIVAGNSN
jgi:predicted dehydrogenase